MNYVEEVTRFLTERGVRVETMRPSGIEVPMFDVLSCPIPFRPNEAQALGAVMDCVLKYQQEVAKQATETVVFLARGSEAQPTGERLVAVRVGVLGTTAEHYFVVGRHGGDVERHPRVHTDLPAWIPCPECDNFLCVIHGGVHAHDCACPELEFWDSELGLNPYEQGGHLTPGELEQLKTEHGYVEE